jgi:lipopolysaccharide/colanic/teichoic acid biosynthesis glycosyltransferase
MGTIGLVAFSIATGIVGSLLAAELLLSCEPLAQWLVRRAARVLPEHLRDRYEPEWLQFVLDVRSPFRKVVHAVAFYIGAWRMVRALEMPNVTLPTQVSIRVLDMTLADSAILLLSPLLLAVSTLMILLESAGPVFIRRRCYGMHGKPFWLYKFRTLTSNGGPSRFGLMLRRTSIDELPALISIARGDMSFVGPKPKFIDKIEALEGNDLNLDFRPGLFSPTDDTDWRLKYGVCCWIKTVARACFSLLPKEQPKRNSNRRDPFL